jgi:hypothetical protein
MASRLLLPFAASAGIDMALTAMPAAAADVSVPVSESPAVHAPRATRHAASHDGNRRLSSILRSNLGCSGVWCGRQFVLIVGISY